ncbi:glycosyltransferase family 4 protein [Enterococcus casseliflavus]|uniref:glycosyltransferase family 4 protein n=1 Tax=Enterococcus casseliflavus TaxID=37734 RepID=UPI001E62D0F4|nr:glycosyltransferase family 4 protein [Enterococcus casseliflavus]MCD4961910.1 glycosyltransferase family 4 protein [Enterococcus casseliflavus]
MKERIVFIVNHDVVIYNFRKELVEKLLEMNYEIFIFSPSGSKIDKLIELGCVHIDISINRHGTNIIEEMKLVHKYYQELKKIKPKVVLTYTIKPNIYGGIASKLLKIPYISNVTGLGNAIENDNFMQKLFSFMYSTSLKGASFVFFQNEDNLNFFRKKLNHKKIDLLPGSGVNLSQFKPLSYPNTKNINFLFLARIMKEKGIDEFLSVAKRIKEESNDVYFHIAGFIDGDYENIIENEVQLGNVIYHGMVDDVANVFKDIHCLVLPSYHEGMSNVVLEACASARPVIASNIPGCKEIVDHNKTGFLCEAKSAESLYEAVEKFIGLNLTEKICMGNKARKKVENNFNRQIIIDKYIERIEGI